MSQKNEVTRTNHKDYPQSGLLSASIARLGSSDNRRVYQALVEIRTKFIKQKDGVARLRQHGGLDRLLQLLSTTDHKTLDVALSVLGNCSMESQTRQKILHKEGIPSIIKAMKNVELDCIRNRACRSLANLAMDKHCCQAIHEEEDALQTIVDCLKKTEDIECQQTYARALRILADTPAHKSGVLDVEGLKAAGELLKSSNVDVLAAALKTVAHFMSDSINVECLRQLISSDALPSLLTLTKHDNSATKHNAKSLLLASLKQEQLRPSLGNAGVIEFLIETVAGDMMPKEKYPYLNALCLCCHEVVNRVRIKDQGGLQLLLKLLDDKKYHLIHYRIISALVCFLYDDQGFETLIQNNMVKILLKHLRRCSKLGTAVPTLHFTMPDIIGEDRDCKPDSQEVLFVEEECKDKPDEAEEDDVSRYLAISVDKLDDLEINLNEKCTDGIPLDDTDNVAEIEPTIEIPCVSSQSEKNTHCFSENLKPLLHTKCSTVNDDNKSLNKDSVATSESIADCGIEIEENMHCRRERGNDNRPNLDSVADVYSIQVQSTSEESSELIKCPVPIVVVDSSTDTESQEADISSSDTDGKLDLSQASTSKITKYSIDSPTYKEVSVWEMGPTSYRAGPTNIYESASYYNNSASASPNRYFLSSPPRTGQYSPMSVSSYLSSDWSPEGSPLRDNSQSTCQSLSPPYSQGSPLVTAGLSPTPAALSEFDLAWDRQSRAEGLSPAWSGSSGTPGMASGFQSPDSLSRAPSPPLNLGTPWWGDVTLTDQVDCAEEYSSEEEETTTPPPQSNDNEIADSTLSLLAETSGEVPDACQRALSADPVYENAMHASDFGQLLEGQSLLRSISADSGSTQSSPTSSRRLFQLKRKRTESSTETKLKILKVVEKSESKSLDIESLISKLSHTVKTPEVEEKHDEVNIHKDPRKTTEHNILVLLSRVSYLPNPSLHLVTQSVIEDLMDYVCKADKPLSRCSRILLRLSKNPHCLEAFILNLIPLLIHLKWLQPSVLNPSTHNTETHSEITTDVVNLVENTSNPKSPSNSQSSGCTPSESNISAQEKIVRELGEQLLNNLSLECETRYGSGLLEHLLLTGVEATKQRTALCLPLVCGSSSFTKRMFLTLNGLCILINCLRKGKHCALTSYSLHILAKKMNIPSYIIQDFGTFTRHELKNEDEDIQQDVTILLDSGTKVRASRLALIGQSNVFAAMLGGHYSEANQSEISIPCATSESFSVLVDFANGKALKSPTGNTLSLDILLDVTALADRYNMPELLLKASSILCHQYMSRENVGKMLGFAVHHNNSFLSKKCLSYVFLSEMSYQDRAAVCSEICSSLRDVLELELYMKDLFTRSISA